MGTFYEAPNDYRNYLCHYGVKGMRWRNRRRSRFGKISVEGVPSNAVEESRRRADQDSYHPSVTGRNRTGSINEARERANEDTQHPSIPRRNRLNTSEYFSGQRSQAARLHQIPVSGNPGKDKERESRRRVEDRRAAQRHVADELEWQRNDRVQREEDKKRSRQNKFRR